MEGQLQGCHRNQSVYNRVAELLNEHGYSRTMEQCRGKLKTMKADYLKKKHNLGKSGTSGRNVGNDEEWDILDEVLSDRPIHNPRHIVDTMTMPTATTSSPPTVESENESDYDMHDHDDDDDIGLGDEASTMDVSAGKFNHYYKFNHI